MEQILSIVASISLEPKYKPLPNVKIIEVEEPNNNYSKVIPIKSKDHGKIKSLINKLIM